MPTTAHSQPAERRGTRLRGQIIIPGDGRRNLPDRNGKLIDGKQRLEAVAAPGSN